MQSYLKEIDEAPLLNAEEERELGTKIQYAAQADDLFRRGEISLSEKEEAEPVNAHRDGAAHRRHATGRSG